MQTVSVGIIGLGRLGGSFGLALKRYSQSKDARQKFSVTGYDPSDGQTSKAKSIGACDQVTRSIVAAARDRNIVLLALPFHEVEGAYQLMGRDLRAGTVVLDASAFQQPSVAWAKKYCGDDVHLVNITPIVNAHYLFDGLDDLEHAAEDYFEKGVILVSPSPSSDPDAVQLATDLAQILGATARFTDPAEHDSWMAAMESLPAALGVATYNAISRQDHWDDVRRVGNNAFGQLTHHLLESHPDALRDLFLRDREGLIRQIDTVVNSLETLRALLAANDRKAIEALLVGSRDDYLEWLMRRRTGDWDPTNKIERETAADTIMTGLFGSTLAKRLKRGGGGDDDG